MNKILGSLLKLYTGSPPQAINCMTDINMDLAAETIDTTCKDDVAGYASNIAGNLSGSLSGSGYVIDNSTNGFDQLFDIYNTRAAVDFKLSDETSGSSYYEGKARITALSKQGGVNGAEQFNFTLTIDGAVTRTPIA